MLDELILLADSLDKLGRKQAASEVDGIIALAIRDFQMTGPKPSTPGQNQAFNAGVKGVQTLLDILGLVPGVGEAADLANAALYLVQGITPQNLLMAALSVTSMVPTLGDVAKVLKYGSSLAPAAIKQIAQMVFRNQGVVRSVFDKMRNPQYLGSIRSMIPNGELLSKYADRMWEALKSWVHNLLNYEVKSEVGSQITSGQSPKTQA